MGKRSRSTMWGLIRTFYLRCVRYTRKLLEHKRWKSRHNKGTGFTRNEFQPVFKSHNETLHKEDQEGATDAGRTIVKTLIERELINEPKSRRESYRKKNSKNQPKQSCEFCACDLNQRNADGGSSQHCSKHKELGDVLQKILNSDNADPVLEIIQDSTSLLVTYIRTLRYSHTLRDKMSKEKKEGGIEGNTERKKVRSRDTKLLLGNEPSEAQNQASNTNVILKSEVKSLARSQVVLVNKGKNERIAQTFLSYIKTRLKTALSSRKGPFHIEKRTTKPKDLGAGDENESAGISGAKVPKIYVEAKKYLSECLSDGDIDGNFSTTPLRDTSGRIISLSESNCFVPSSERHSADTVVTESTRLSYGVKLQNGDGQNIETESNLSQSVEDRILELPARINIADFLVPNNEVVEITVTSGDDTNSEDNEDTSKASAEVHSEDIGTGHLYKETNSDRWVEHMKKESYDGPKPFLCPFSPPSIASEAEKLENIDAGLDSMDQPSPVSVLEPYFMDEEIALERTRLRSIEHPIRLLQITFEDEDVSETTWDVYLETYKEDEESIMNYVKTVLQAFTLDWDQIYLNSEFSDQLIENSVLDEVDLLCSRTYYDKKLLFDCINEVLWEMCKHHVCFCPSLLLSNPCMRPVLPIHEKANTIHRVCKRVDWHLVPLPLPRSLQQVVEKDLSDAAPWMDFNLDIGSLGFELGDVIVEELIAETISTCTETNPALYQTKWMHQHRQDIQTQEFH